MVRLVGGNVNRQVTYDLEYVDQKLQLSVMFDGQGVDAAFKIQLEPDFFIDKLAQAIPGTLDDAIFEMIKAAFLKK